MKYSVLYSGPTRISTRDGEKTGTIISKLFRDRNCSKNEQIVGTPCSEITVIPWSGIQFYFRILPLGSLNSRY